MTQTRKLLLIDGNSIAFRAFFALYQQLDRFTNQDGLHTNAIYAFNNMLEIVLKQVQPDYALVAFDAGKTTFRTHKFAEYKGGRAKTPDELREQLPYIKELLDDLGIKHYELADYEADDIIGTMAKRADAAGWETTIVTGDRDLTQLTTDRTTVQVTVKGVNELEAYTPAHVQEKLGITPAQIIELKGLMGDTSDNYPGVTKVGEKTALKLLTTYGTIDRLYEQIDAMKSSKLKENLINDKEKALLSRELATIDRDAPVTLDLDQLTYTGPDVSKLTDFYQQMNMQSLLKKLGTTPKVTMDAVHYTVLDEAKILELVKTDGPITFEIEMLADNYHLAEQIGFFIGTPTETYVSTDVTLLTLPEVTAWLSEKNRDITVFDGKRNIVAADRLNLPLTGITFDVLLASYLIDPDDNSNDLGKIADDHGYQQLPRDEAVYGKGAKRQVPEETVLFDHFARKSAALFALRPDLTADLKKQDQADLFTDMEMPLSRVLAQMEIAGITLDKATLKDMGTTFADSLHILEEKIYAAAGTAFNLNSPKQLGEILFEKLNLPVIKKTKTGYATSVDVLTELQSANPIIGDILNYRSISKLQSTYVKGLLKAQMPDKKIHTRYLQTLTQTGRLSSVDPNMQNIPARDEGKIIRKAFVPSHPDWVIFSSDYSQIELRVLAHISGDKNMQNAFKQDLDIHANTAMKIFHLDSPDQVTPDMRRQAKATNFGIVYGISDYGLSQNIGISRQQAKTFIEGYFDQYPKVKDYMAKMVTQAREQGYVETLFHRRRYLAQIHSRNFNLRKFAERTAMNTPIQGSAADIIKVAMIRMQAALAQQQLQAKMLLQVHDELIFEAPEAEVAKLEALVPKIMDSAVSLDVPLKVESHYGKTWFDAK